jgi:hypothetical protein
VAELGAQTGSGANDSSGRGRMVKARGVILSNMGRDCYNTIRKKPNVKLLFGRSPLLKVLESIKAQVEHVVAWVRDCFVNNL